MDRVRRHVSLIALATLSLQTLVLALGATRVCWDHEHTHRGRLAPDCAMHHQSDGSQSSTTHSHHGHQHTNGPTSDRTEQIRCSCADDIPGFFIGELALVAQPAAVVPPNTTPVVYLSRRASLPDADVTPLAPPPRFITFS